MSKSTYCGKTFADNESINGTIDVALIHYNSKNSKSYLPAGGIAQNPVGQDNKALPDPFDFLQTAGVISIEMSTQKHEIIKKFSIPVKVNIEINAAIVNPITNKNITEGDKIPLISYDTDIGVWKEESEVQITKNSQSGKFEASFDISHLTYWVLGWKRNICRIGPSFTIKSDNKDLDILYYSQLVDANTNLLIKDFYISLNNGSVTTISYIPKTTENVKLRVFDFNNYYGGDNKTSLIESIALPLCEVSNVTLDLSKLPIPKYVELDIKVICPQRKVLDVAALPAQMKVQYSEPDKNTWKDAGLLTRFNTKVKTYRMQLGKKYDMRGSTDGGVTWPYVQKNHVFDKQTWSFELPGKEYCK